MPRLQLRRILTTTAACLIATQCCEASGVGLDAPHSGRAAAESLPGADTVPLDHPVFEFLRHSTEIASSDIPLANGRGVLATLAPMDPLASGAAVTIMQPDGSALPAVPSIRVWRGECEGDAESDVFLAVSPTQVHGWVRTAGSVSLITTVTTPQGRQVVIYDASGLGPGVSPVCAGALEVPGGPTREPTGQVLGLRSTPMCRAFDIAVEADLEFTRTQPTAQDAVDYAVVLIAATSSIFNREAGMGLRICFLRIWNRDDPWSASDSGSQLNEFRDHWLANMAAQSRSTAHLLSGRNLGGGVAYLGVACNQDWSFGVSGNLAGHFPFPVQHNNPGNWDVHVVSHELGHIFGSGHTHNSCEYEPIIDACGLNPDPAAGCESGTPDCSAALAGNGTIMSYCHICQGGESNLQMVFGPRVAARISEFASTRSCGTEQPRLTFSGITAMPGAAVCQGESVTLTALATGPDLRYQWFRDGQRITGAALPSLVIQNPANGARYDVMVSSPCSLVRTLGGPGGVTVAVHQCCAADFDGNGVREVPDIFAFLSAWFAQDARADLDGVAGTSVPDIFTFLSLWFAGC